MKVFAGLKGAIGIFGQIALGVIILIAFYKIIIVYAQDQAIKPLVKKFIGACIFIGAASGLVDLSVFVGESLVNPLKQFISSLSKSISGSL